MKATKTTKVYSKFLTNSEKDEVSRAISHIKYPEENYAEYLEKINFLGEGLHHIFFELFERSSMSQGYPHFDGAIKIGNLPIDDQVPMPPQNSSSMKRIKKESYISENVLILIASLFGKPYSMASEGLGLVNNLIPKLSTLQDFSGTGASSDLHFHIENSALRFLSMKDCSPKALFLTGVRQEKLPPSTKLSDARLAIEMLSEEDRLELQKPQYKIRLPYRWREVFPGNNELTTPPIPLLKPSIDGLIVNAVFYGDMIADYGSSAGERAASLFEEALEKVSISEIVKPGEVLCIDNRVTLHARTPFEASFDDI